MKKFFVRKWRALKQRVADIVSAIWYAFKWFFVRVAVMVLGISLFLSAGLALAAHMDWVHLEAYMESKAKTASSTPQVEITDVQKIRNGILNDPQFIKEAEQKKLEEAEIRAYKKQQEILKSQTNALAEQQKRITDELTKMSTKGFSKAERITALTTFLKSKGSPLAKDAAKLVELPRFVEAIAISGGETQFCTTGVAVTNNNCGGIRPKGAVSGFQKYSSHYESIVAISTLLSKPAYKSKTITEMNGIYCTEEEGSPMGKCPRWEGNIYTNINRLLNY